MIAIHLDRVSVTYIAQPIFTDLKAELKLETDRLQKILLIDLPAFNKEAQRLGLPPIVVNKPVVF